MALHESALEELGLAPRWVRRASGREQAAPEAGQADAVAVSAAPERAAGAPGEAARREAAVNDLRQVPRREPGEPRIAPEVARREDPQAAPRTGAAEDDFTWFDDVHAQASTQARTQAPTHASSPTHPQARTTDDAAAPSIAVLDWDALSARVAGCERCRLCEKRTQTVFGVGDRNAEWMLIGEAPGENEDRQGEPFVGQAGKLLDNMLRSLSLARGANVYIANVIKCRPPGNRNPEPDEVARCEPYLQRQVALVKPKLIVALGRFAAQSLLKTDASISSLRGRVHQYEGVPVIVTYHPAYLLRSLNDKAKSWQDLCLARDTWQKAADGQGRLASGQTAGAADNRAADSAAGSATGSAANPAAGSATASAIDSATGSATASAAGSATDPAAR